MSTLLSQCISFSSCCFFHTVPRLPSLLFSLLIAHISYEYTCVVTSPWYTRKHNMYLRIFIGIWKIVNFFLFSQLDSYSQARLTMLASSNDTSSWLRAPPIPSLGLSMPPNEFPLVVRIWLGIPSFPSTPALLCPCGSVIDPNGDHV